MRSRSRTTGLGVCTPHPLLNLIFFSSLPSSHSFLLFLLQSGMTHQYCCGAYRKCRFDRPVERGSTVAALTCVCIAEPQPGNTRSILMTSPTPTHCSRLPLLFAVETSSLTQRKEQASGKEQELALKRRGCLRANGEWESFGGRWREADSASGLGLAHTYIHRKGRGEGILPCIVKTSIVYYFAAGFCPVRWKSSDTVFTCAFVDFSWHGKWWNGNKGLCGLASGQQTLGWNTSLTSQAMLFLLLSQRSFILQWTRWRRQQHFLGLLPHQLLSFGMLPLTCTCGG